MRIALVTESFLPVVNGVTNSCLRILEHVERRGHHALVVAPGTGPTHYAGADVLRTPAVPLPMWRDFALGLPTGRLEPALRWFEPDVLHLASPVTLGAQAAYLARHLGLPSLAAYQTDLAGFALQYRLGRTVPVLRRWLAGVHSAVDRTLAPSQAAIDDLRALGVPRVHRWARGVDTVRFTPTRRSEPLRGALRRAPDEVIVGYVGRLAKEKRLHMLAAVARLPNVRLVLIGDGPARARLQQQLPDAVFLGFLQGEALATAVASLDVFVHTGAAETFCQSAQEALASGVPVVAPAAGGLTDFVLHEHNGLLWHPRSVAELRASVSALVRNAPLRNALAARARPSVADRSWEVLGDQLLDHYRTVAGVVDRTAVRSVA
jgi:phosphatidylinositol alpha 1,6-mannosyltransferase